MSKENKGAEILTPEALESKRKHEYLTEVKEMFRNLLLGKPTVDWFFKEIKTVVDELNIEESEIITTHYELYNKVINRKSGNKVEVEIWKNSNIDGMTGDDDFKRLHQLLIDAKFVYELSYEITFNDTRNVPRLSFKATIGVEKDFEQMELT